MKLLNYTIALFLGFGTIAASAQTFTSSADGAFSTGSNWSGGTAPPLSGQGYGSVTVQNNMSTSASYTVGSMVLTVSANKTFTINGSLTLSNNGGSINVYGTLIITGNLTASSDANKFTIYPGGKVIVQGDTYINNNNVISVGTNAAAPPYADFVMEGNLFFSSGGSGMTVNKNGRVALYGNLTSSGGGGQKLQINNGGQMYVNGNITLNGGGDQVTANNTTPYGLYVNGTSTVNGGGSSITSNKGDKSTMQSQSPGFYNWVAAQPSSPLPITLLYFSVAGVLDKSVELAWATSSELNFNYFLIERSGNGKDFQLLGQVQGHGTTTQPHQYSITDTNPLVGTNYYRLTSVDFDGSTQVFQIIAAEFLSNRKISVYPNPVADHNLHVDTNFDSENPTQVIIMDWAGTIKWQTSFSENQAIIPISLEPGIYIAKVSNGSLRQICRLVIP
ncbi:MAG: T9SS type A sorting domain-containing protein [Bacteroidetes bacterium]|nr:T9SS type A sorting domain-containing protein [Bacteroidota bacterium]